jgi:hypothetical protein
LIEFHQTKIALLTIIPDLTIADSAPITTRQLESTIRLTEARARAELREEATEQVCVCMHACLKVTERSCKYKHAKHNASMNLSWKFIIMVTAFCVQYGCRFHNDARLLDCPKQDALDVVEMIKSSLADVLEDEHGQIGMSPCARFSLPVCLDVESKCIDCFLHYYSALNFTKTTFGIQSYLSCRSCFRWFRVPVLSPDFRRGRGMSRGKQSQAFMKALKREAEANGGENIFTEQQVCA